MVNSRWSIVIVCLAIFLGGCGSDQYSIERQHWKLKKEAEKIFKNPHTSPPNELERVVSLFNNFVQKYPKSALSVDAEFNIARLYIVKKEYHQARSQLKKILDKHRASEDISSEAIFLIGNSYEIEDKWDSALQQYEMIKRKYPITLRGINIPIYIAQHYKIKYQPDKMIAAFKEAIVHYKALADKYPNSPLNLKARSLAAQSYMVLKDWQNAADSLKAIIADYKDKFDVSGIMLDLALIYSRELQDRVKATEILESLIKDYPNSKLTKTATALLEEWKKNE